ncbi:MAG: hypothetical protein QF645_01080 [Planctomycetota bacterium]|nr:hypothetical protein [Planctomycetota bacterium]
MKKSMNALNGRQRKNPVIGNRKRIRFLFWSRGLGLTYVSSMESRGPSSCISTQKTIRERKPFHPCQAMILMDPAIKIKAPVRNIWMYRFSFSGRRG